MRAYLYCTLFVSCLAIRTGIGQQTTSADTARELFGACKDAIRFMDAKGSGDPGRADYCFGYFEGYANVATFDGSALCLGGARIGTMARVYVAYMEKNPKELDYPNVIGATEALKESYGCPAGSDKH